MHLSDIFNKSVKTVKSNSPEILTAFGITGVVGTAYLAGKASFKAAEIIRREENGMMLADRKQRIKERTKLVWKCYIPAGVSGVATIGCIVGASKLTGRRTAAAVAAYSVTERAFSEYREKVVEQVGKNKEQKLRDEIAQAHTADGPSKEVVVMGTGNILCCELYTRRYFRSDHESLRKAENDINAMIIGQIYVTLDEFYDQIGLAYTSKSGNLGWDSDRLLELEFSTTLSESGEPCLAFDYNYLKPLR